MSSQPEYRRHDTAAEGLPSAVRRRVDEALRPLVYVYDDDPRTLRTFQQLAARGWEVRRFASAAAALPVLVEEPPVAVAAELRSRAIDGVAFLREVAELRPRVRRILMSHAGGDRDILRAINEAGVHCFLDKPVTLDALLDVLEASRAARRRELAIEYLVDDVRTQNERLGQARDALERREAHLVHTERLAVLGRLTDGLATGLRPLLLQLREVTDQLCRVVDDPEEAELLTMGHDAVDTVSDIIDDIHRFTRDHELVIEREPTDVAALVQRSVQFARLDRRLKARRVHLRVEPVGMVALDPRKIRQVLLNLLRNAAEATSDGGRIAITLTGTEELVVLAVADEGTGMPSGVSDHVFEEFFTTKGQEGLGLGLSMARHIVEEHGGTITCTSRTGGGSTFLLRLPRR